MIPPLTSSSRYGIVVEFDYTNLSEDPVGVGRVEPVLDVGDELGPGEMKRVNAQGGYGRRGILTLKEPCKST